MKLAKKISKGIALCAALTIMGAMGGVITSCSNGSDGADDTPPKIKDIADVDEVTFVAIKDSVGADFTNIVFTYARSENGAKEKITIKDCDIEVLYNGDSVLKITELVFALNEYGDFMGDKATQYQCKKSIGKKINVGDTVTVKFNEKTGGVIGEGVDSAKIKTLSVSLIDNDEKAGDDGWYNELVENKDEYRPLFPPKSPDLNPDEKEIVFDFTKVEAGDDDNAKIDNVSYCSAKFSSFSEEEGLTLEVNDSWAGAFKISVIESLDLNNKNCVIEYKIDDGWTYTGDDGKKCLVQLISKEETSGEYRPIEMSQGEFANDPVEADSWQKKTIDNIYKNNWEVENDDKDKDSYVGADLTKIIAIKINTMDGKGTIHIKSIKFVDKE